MVAGVLLPGATSAAAAGAKETAPMGLRLLFVDDEPVSVWPFMQWPTPSPSSASGSQRFSLHLGLIPLALHEHGLSLWAKGQSTTKKVSYALQDA